MIPQEKNSVVTKGLREAFGVTEYDDIRRMTKGHNFALVFRIVVRGSAFLLRIIMRPNTMVGPEREIMCMKAAVEAGLAPRVWYISLEDGITITDFVEEVPFPAPEALVRMPTVLRTLHALPPFPKGLESFDTSCMFLLHKGPAVEGFLQKFQAANLLSKDDCGQLLDWRSQVAAVYPRHEPDMVSSHNDMFKPDNTLFDGHRVWLVDWEAAFLNDRYADLAVVANLLVADGAEEGAYLHAYFGQPPDQYQLARFFLMRQVTHMFYAVAFLFLGSAGEPVNQTEEVPEFRAFQRRMWAGEVNLTDQNSKILYARVHWAKLVENMRCSTRFDEALRIVSDRHPRAQGEARSL